VVGFADAPGSALCGILCDWGRHRHPALLASTSAHHQSLIQQRSGPVYEVSTVFHFTFFCPYPARIVFQCPHFGGPTLRLRGDYLAIVTLGVKSFRRSSKAVMTANRDTRSDRWGTNRDQGSIVPRTLMREATT